MARNIFRSFVSEMGAVIKAADRQTQQVYSKWGAFARRNAKGLIRKFKKPSKPGNPPHSHTGLLKRFIFFAWDPSRRSEIVGPAKLNGTLGDAPQALEHGGQSTVRTGSRRRGWKMEKVTIAARPYIEPAALKANAELPSLWPKSVKS
jgi:hypothetical protein